MIAAGAVAAGGLIALVTLRSPARLEEVAESRNREPVEYELEAA